MSTLYVDTINEKTSGNGIEIPGHVLQVVSGKHSSQSSTTGNTFIDFPLDVSITPTSSSSKILVMLSFTGGISSDNHLYARVLRGSTAIGENVSAFFAQTAGVSGGTLSIHELDEPNTTSTLTYKAQFKSRDNGETVYMQYSNAPSVLTLVEIGG